MLPRIFLFLALIFSLLGGAIGARAQTTNMGQDEFNNLVARVMAKAQKGIRLEKEYADELRDFDNLYLKYRNDPVNASHIIFTKATLYHEILGNDKKCVETLYLVKRNFPTTPANAEADKLLAKIQLKEAGRKLQPTLVPGVKFPDFAEKDFNNKPLASASYRGKVLLVLFWASWHEQSRAEAVKTQMLYEKYHAKDLEVIGVSLDNDLAKLKGFLAENNIKWPQYYDGQAGDNKLALRYGIPGIPSSYLLDKQGKIFACGVYGDEMEKAVVKVTGAK